MNFSNINKFNSIFKNTFLFILFFIFTSFLFSSTIFDIKSKIESNYYSFNLNKHFAIIKNIKELENSELKYYFLSLEYHTLGKIIYNQDQDRALNYFENSIKSIEKAISMNKNKNQSILAEYYAILSSALGKKSSLSTFSSLYWGLESKKAFDKAFTLDSNNRKVRLIGSIHLMHVPEVLGGDKKKARVTLTKILNQENNDSPNTINWADKAEIFAYLAQIDILEGKSPNANIDSALKYQPNYDFVLIDLKNQMKK